MTTEDIYNEIIAVKESGDYPELDELNSTSRVSIWRLWVFIFAFFSKTLQELFVSFQAYIEEFFAKNQHGTLLWWLVQIEHWQYGDALEFISGVWKYPVLDTGKQIVAQSALEVLGSVLIFKVAKDDGSGNLTALSAIEQTELLAYINQVKFPGTLVSLVSLLADDI